MAKKTIEKDKSTHENQPPLNFLSLIHFKMEALTNLETNEDIEQHKASAILLNREKIENRIHESNEVSEKTQNDESADPCSKEQIRSFCTIINTKSDTNTALSKEFTEEQIIELEAYFERSYCSVINRLMPIESHATLMVLFKEEFTEEQIIELEAYLNCVLYHEGSVRADNIGWNLSDLENFHMPLNHLVNELMEKREGKKEQDETKASLEIFFEKIPTDLDIKALNELYKILTDIAYGTDYRSDDFNFYDRRMKGREKHHVLTVIFEIFINNIKKFEKVFQTSKGSTYFQIKTGESLRIKKSKRYPGELEKDPIITIEKPTKETFFLIKEEVDTEKAKEKHYTLSYPFLLNRPFTNGNYEVGSVVVETNYASSPPVLKVDSNDNSVCFSYPSNESGMLHMGHEITKIIK